MRILAVGAHPDDLEILCAGTLARYTQQGNKVIMCHVTNGDKGHYEVPPHELAPIRQREAENAAEVIGADIIDLGLPDAGLAVDIPTRMVVVDVIREAAPDIIITHSPDDYAPDHVAASRLVFDASYICTAPSVKTVRKAHSIVTPIFYMDTLAGMNFIPEEYVDITDTIETKKSMLSMHKSQLDWLEEHGGLDIMDFVETTARFRGLQAGVRYAEAFRRLHCWPRESTRRLLP